MTQFIAGSAPSGSSPNKILLITKEKELATAVPALQRQYPQADIEVAPLTAQLETQNTSPPPNELVLVLGPALLELDWLKAKVTDYSGRFVSINYSQSMETTIRRLDNLIQLTSDSLKNISPLPYFDSRWIKLLELKFYDALSDKAIAAQMGISDRTVRNYWMRIQDTLGIADDSSRDLRIQIQQAAQKLGLLSE